MSGRLVLVRHGQSHGNVGRRLDTRPPGAELTDLGREQAVVFARGLSRPPAMIAHSIATRIACSWNSGTPSVLPSTFSSSGVG